MKKMTDEEIIQWNATFDEGHPCYLHFDDGHQELTRTRSPAWNLSSGHSVVLVEGKTGAWCVDRVEMVNVAKTAAEAERNLLMDGETFIAKEK